MSLIELMVGLAVLAIALAIGMPSFGEWISNTQIRSTAESLQNGLNLARAEAVRRNTVVRLQFTDTLDNDCALTKTGTHWVINGSSSETAAGSCGKAISDADAPFLLQKSGIVASKLNATIDASQAAIAFNGLGRVAPTTNPDTNVGTLTVNVASSRGSCLKDSGTMRCLRVVVTPGGQVRMCDPHRTTVGDPLAC
ncbi:GspH/FimT family pseudopilin [Variovorax sp. J31P216]|uniref:GspH/FimT family pseudopilin n=1 Tax=Variovorax saccharolyticus TaxID=3053516 RepID=UPI002575D0D1|nr:GspH/FimT family pseudopilin [Variovorax sp. J31P216]MDM0027647.1 GspH/FimT family pseudopilin [Variovorax sp. J31P216]